jgi:hypothetical protein
LTLTEFAGTVVLAVGAGLVEAAVASGRNLLDAVRDGLVVGTVLVTFDVGVVVVTLEVGAETSGVDLEVVVFVGVAAVAVPTGVVGVTDGEAELLFLGPRREEGHGCKGEPSLVRFRLWWMGLPEVAWQTPYLKDLPKVLSRNATRFASVSTVNPPPSNQFLVAVTFAVPPSTSSIRSAALPYAPSA